MDNKIKKRYLRIKKDQEKLKDEIEKKNEELKVLRLEEEEIAGQEILAICKDKKISLIDAIDVFSNNEKMEKREAKAFEVNDKENMIYGN